MFLILKCVLGIVLFLKSDINANPEIGNDRNITISTRIQEDHINDTIIEIFHRCKCVLYYQCDELNRYIITRARFKRRKPLKCSDENYICCSEPEEPAAEIINIGPISNNPEDVMEKMIYLNSSKCGVPKTVLNVRILTPEMESATTIYGEIPWMVAIFEKQEDLANPYSFRCAGSLIHPQVVLTATHCLPSTKKSLRVVATGGEIFQKIGIEPKNERNVMKIITHPEYYFGGLYNDIALLILQEQYDFSKYPINSVCLPKNNQRFDGKLCLAVGWGENSYLSSVPLRKVDVPIISFRKCQKLFRKSPLGADFNLHSSFLCAGGEAGKDTCKGDGGGPLMCLGEDQCLVQVGIISWGVSCGVANEPGAYTDVAKFRHWIQQELAKNELSLTK